MLLRELPCSPPPLSSPTSHTCSQTCSHTRSHTCNHACSQTSNLTVTLAATHLPEDKGPALHRKHLDAPAVGPQGHLRGQAQPASTTSSSSTTAITATIISSITAASRGGVSHSGDSPGEAAVQQAAAAVNHRKHGRGGQGAGKGLVTNHWHGDGIMQNPKVTASGGSCNVGQPHSSLKVGTLVLPVPSQCLTLTNVTHRCPTP